MTACRAGLVTPVIDYGVGTNADRWIGYATGETVESAQRYGYGTRTDVYVIERAWFDVCGNAAELPDGWYPLDSLRYCGGAS